MTPLMRQYWDIKALHQDKILLFRMGDFFEMFFDDAVKAAPILGIALTQRNKKSADETPMCGMPHHSIAGPINKLLKQGLKVAICDQIEDPKTAKGIVKRAVTRILTPGMVYDSDTLEQTLSHYISALDEDSISFLDTTTGEGFYFSGLQPLEQKRLLELLPVAEIVVEKKENLSFEPGLRVVSEHTGILSSHPLLGAKAPISAARLLSYVQSLGGEESLKTLKSFAQKSLQQRLELTATTLRHLEIFSTYKGEGEGSLYHAINRTVTSAGSRLLRQWLSFPLLDVHEIQRRHHQIEHWRQDSALLKKFREVLSQMGDVERRLGKISQPQCNGRDLLALAQSLEAGMAALQMVGKTPARNLADLASAIQRTLVEEPPLQTRQGHLIREGVSSELDELIQLSTNSQNLLQKMEDQERAKTGISSLKIRYNNVFGYYIEITHTHKDKVPANYMRKQTLANAERFCTEELIELEKKVLSAQTKRADLEFAIFENLRSQVLKLSSELLTLAAECSECDVLSALAWLSFERKYVCPQFVTGALHLKSSRHPVVEQTVKKSFVPNDILIDQGGCLLLTGPNMAGKSTLMRQVALTVILAQMGSYVPADQAQLPLFDHIFTRIGASDQLSEGLSTFMVEMTETAEMLKRSTKHSLLILDEIGRGTSTYDGMSLAQAILEHVISELKATTLFATHYHELTSLENLYPQLRNAHMTVSERGGEIRFLHTLVQGPATKSYGIQVAKIAGLPQAVTARAQKLLQEIETKRPAQEQLSLMSYATVEGPTEAPAVPEPMRRLIEQLKDYPVMQKTPIEAMNMIAQWQQTLSEN